MSIGLLDWLLQHTAEVAVSPWTIYMLNQDVLEQEVYGEAEVLVARIETALTSGRAAFEIAEAPSRLGDEADQANGEASAVQSWQSTSALAAARGVPLWSDDLVTKVVHCHETTGEGVFSTRTVLDLASERGLIDSDLHSSAVVGLARHGFHYCSFNGTTLAWSLHQHNYQSNDDTDMLLANKGDPESFETVVAHALAEMATRHEEAGQPSTSQLTMWMRRFALETGPQESVSPQFIGKANFLLRQRSWSVRTLWDTLLRNFERFGRIGAPSRLVLPETSDAVRLWTPDDGTWRA